MSDIECRARDWTLRLEPAPHLVGIGSKAVVEAFERVGAFMLTHLGKAERHPDADGTVDELVDVLEGFGWGLGFAVGRWCHPVAPVALSSAEEPVWERWSVPRQPAPGPLPLHFGEARQRIERTCAAFLAEWRDNPADRRTLEHIVDYHVQANEHPSHRNIILGHAALEMLTSYCCKNSRGIGHQQIRKCLEDKKIYHELSQKLSEPVRYLIDNAKEKKDFVDVIVEYRNTIAHPVKKSLIPFRKDDQEMQAIWKLQQTVVKELLLACIAPEDRHDRS